MSDKQQYDEFKAALAQFLKDYLIGINEDVVHDRAWYLARRHGHLLWIAIGQSNHRAESSMAKLEATR